MANAADRVREERRLAALSDRLASLDFPAPSRVRDQDATSQTEYDIKARDESLSDMNMADPESASRSPDADS